MGESTVPSIDSGVSCSEEGPINDVVDTSTANLRATLSSQHRGERDLQAVKAGAFQFQQVAVYAVPFPPSAVSEESGSDAPGSLEREADVNEQQYASPGGQAPESMTALFPRMEGPVALVLLCLFVLERRIASLEAAIEALSTRVGVPSPSIRSPGTCPSTESGPASSFAAQSQSSVYQVASNDDDMCERSEALLGTNTIKSVNPNCCRCPCHRDFRSQAPPERKYKQGPPRVPDHRGEQAPPRGESTFCQPSTGSLSAMYNSNLHEPRSRRHQGVHEGHLHDSTAADSRSITWTPNSLALLASRAFERGHDEEVFSPVSQIAGYQVRLYARCATKGGCSVLSFCAQVCVGMKNRGVSRPFRGTLKFTIHHPTCSAKSKVYIVPVLHEERNSLTSDLSQTICRLTGFIPETILRSEGLWVAGTLRVSLCVCT